jgi:hypothetical protein
VRGGLLFETSFESENMSIVHQGNAPAAVVFAAPQHRECGTASLPSPADIERMQRADRTRSGYFSAVASGLAASWREVPR